MSAPASLAGDDLAADLLQAVARDELRVHYQPVISVTDGRVTGVEALARWQRTDRMLDTQQFLSRAETSGAIVPVGRWVLERACHDVVVWNASHPERPLRLAVNLSSRQLTEPDVVEDVARVLQLTGLEPSGLSLELSEGTFHELAGAAGSTLAALKGLGVRLSVDDFGTAASSLIALQRYQPDELKIDRTLVSQMDVDGAAAALVRAAMAVARSLGIETVAEGVERRPQAEMLRELRCGAAQGWLYARPGPDIEGLVIGAEQAALDAGLAPSGAFQRGGPDPAAAPDELVRLFASVFGTVPVGVALVDGTGRHVAANPALADLLGHPQDALLEGTCWETVHPEDLHDDLAGMDSILHGGCERYVVHERLVGADGDIAWVEVAVSRVAFDERAHGRGRLLLRQVRSIAESRRTSEDAAALRSIVAASPDALVITDERGRCAHWNPAAERLFGWTEGEMVGSTLTRLVALESQHELARRLATAAAGGEARWADATWMSSRGGPLAVDVTVAPVTGGSGARAGLVVIARDVAEQRSAAAALEQAHEALAAQVTELGHVNVRLESFASMLTHDLLQPVAALDGFLTLLARDATELDDDHRSWLDAAIRSVDRTRQAIGALHRNATAEELPLVSLDLGAVVDDLVPGLVAEVGASQVIIGDLPVVVADPGFVTQVLANLVQNAGRYRHEERPLEIEIRSRREGSSWVVIVADSGRGIASDELERVFEAGARGSSADGTQGTGTGLATVRTLMQRMGGDVWAEPEPAGGVRMCLRFMAADPASQPEPPATAGQTQQALVSVRSDQGLLVGTPPGTRTQNLRIKSPTL